MLMSQPFKVKDYVKIGDLEGRVEEISINYTSLYTPARAFLYQIIFYSMRNSGESIE